MQQTVGANTTNYLLDVQAGLWKVLGATTGANTTRYVHGLRGLLTQQNPDSSWNWLVADALGSVRGALNASLTPLESRQYSPYGEPSQLSGSSQSTYGFTGEPTDGNGLINLRARYMNPALGQFLSLDKVELGNRYSYVGGDPVNRVDPSGMFGYSPYLTPGGTGGGWKPKPVTPAKPTPTQTQQTPGTPPTQPSHWIGGAPPLGYQPDGSLINIPSEQLQAYNPLRTLGNILAPIAQLWINLFVDSSWSQFIRDVAERPKDTLIGGYIEGLAGSYSVGGAVGGGREIVYNFRTFERLGYTYTGHGIASAYGTLAGQYYTGHVEGFIPSRSSTAYQTFNDQYHGEFDVVSAGVSAQIPSVIGVSAGVVHFYSGQGAENPVYGNAVYNSASLGGVSLPGVEGSLGAFFYVPDYANSRSYIENCQVNTVALVGDILTGAGSPQIQGVGGVLVPSRWVASASAVYAAGNYNRSHSSC